MEYEFRRQQASCSEWMRVLQVIGFAAYGAMLRSDYRLHCYGGGPLEGKAKACSAKGLHLTSGRFSVWGNPFEQWEVVGSGS